MALAKHGNEKYHSSTLIGTPAEGEALRVERRNIGSGAQNCVRPECTELVYILAGRARVRRTGDGKSQEGIAWEGTSRLVPAGTHETQLELDGSVECLLIYLPPKLLEQSALADYGINPDQTGLAYVGALADPILSQIGKALNGLTGRSQSLERLFADGLRTTLAAHLLRNYSVESLKPTRAPSLDGKRLQRVLDLIEARLGEEITLEELAREACLSPFHFSRLFHQTTGLPPHRFVIDRRIRAAQRMLQTGQLSIAEIAFDTGFGSQANFTRTFRKLTGTTPGQFRGRYRGLGSETAISDHFSART
ncbi:helix-turn-helix domain-containing protein [Rhizobium halophytocola]|uniref:AraC family transcriptional regulator n=1 Tax=Rhizobium halophytocola TaxID=735519 RepID=A0ABS4E4N2_9HYPH|nr:AraC family transcriptional regulator [Rhizobium halophytocola]MBP1852905.1 AraC family transcriptional regulator [Rhizobium halophytocola]